MRKFKVDIWDKGEYDHPASYGFVPFIKAYLHEDVKEAGKGVMLVAPGGGYCMCVPHEGEPVALDFYERGYDVYVLAYTTDITFSFPLKDQPLKDIARAVRLIRRARLDAGIRDEKLFICGFSAGAHLAASLGTMWADPFLYERTGAPEGCFRVRGMILCYPVITSGKFCNAGSFVNLLKDGADDPEKRRAVSLETKVGPDTVPAYIWHTSDDPGVPVENSLLFASALSANRVPFELHVFPHGPHGMSLCDAQTGMPDAYVARWVDEAIGWMERT